MRYTGWAKLNGANAVSFVVVKHVLENFDNFGGEITVHLRILSSIKIKHFTRGRYKSYYGKQELSYRKQIARQLRTQFVEGISVTLKSTLRVTKDHWKRNHWTDK